MFYIACVKYIPSILAPSVSLQAFCATQLTKIQTNLMVICRDADPDPVGSNDFWPDPNPDPVKISRDPDPEKFSSILMIFFNFGDS